MDNPYCESDNFENLTNKQINKLLMIYLGNDQNLSETNKLLDMDNIDVVKIILLKTLARLNNKEEELVNLIVKYDLICGEILSISKMDIGKIDKYDMLLGAVYNIIKIKNGIK